MPSSPPPREQPESSSPVGQGLSRSSVPPKVPFRRGVWEENKRPLRTDPGCATSLCLGLVGFSPSRDGGSRSGQRFPTALGTVTKTTTRQIPAAVPENKQGG